MTFWPKVSKVEQNHELRWLGRAVIPDLFDGEHSFTIQPLNGGRVRFVQQEGFTGLFVPFFSTEGAQRGFAEMNMSIKAPAEESVRCPQSF